MTGIADLMASFGNNISKINKQIFSVGTAICAKKEETGKLLMQLFATYADCSQDNEPFTHYIEILENKYNDGTLNLLSKDLMYKEEVQYNKIKDKHKFKVN